jgi:hypothetical protein
MAGFGFDVGSGRDVAAEKIWFGSKYLSCPTFSTDALTRRRAEEETTES